MSLVFEFAEPREWNFRKNCWIRAAKRVPKRDKN